MQFADIAFVAVHLQLSPTRSAGLRQLSSRNSLAASPDFDYVDRECFLACGTLKRICLERVWCLSVACDLVFRCRLLAKRCIFYFFVLFLRNFTTAMHANAMNRLHTTRLTVDNCDLRPKQPRSNGKPPTSSHVPLPSKKMISLISCFPDNTP